MGNIYEKSLFMTSVCMWKCMLVGVEWYCQFLLCSPYFNRVEHIQTEYCVKHLIGNEKVLP